MVSRTLSLVLLLLICLAAPGGARTGSGAGVLSGPTEPRPDQILLLDGTLIFGKIISEDDTTIVIETKNLGTLSLPQRKIAEIHRGKSGKTFRKDPDYNSIMFCPTPATLPTGANYFRDFELFFLNFGYGVSDRLNVSFATLFPITSTWLMGSGGAKFMLLDREVDPLGLAFTGSFTKLHDEDGFTALGVVAGFGDRDRSLNFNLNWSWGVEGDGNGAVLIGGDMLATPKSKLFAEWGNGTNLWENNDGFRGFLNFGIRFFSSDMSFSMSGFRPLEEGWDGFLAWPMIMFSMHY